MTPIGELLVGSAPNPFVNPEPNYAVYNKSGKVIKGGFDKHSEAVTYARNIPVSSEAVQFVNKMALNPPAGTEHWEVVGTRWVKFIN
jgi:hypothetical protein